jgi:hypothetical protein
MGAEKRALAWRTSLTVPSGANISMPVGAAEAAEHQHRNNRHSNLGKLGTFTPRISSPSGVSSS